MEVALRPSLQIYGPAAWFFRSEPTMDMLDGVLFAWLGPARTWWSLAPWPTETRTSRLQLCESPTTSPNRQWQSQCPTSRSTAPYTNLVKILHKRQLLIKAEGYNAILWFGALKSWNIICLACFYGLIPLREAKLDWNDRKSYLVDWATCRCFDKSKFRSASVHVPLLSALISKSSCRMRSGVCGVRYRRGVLPF